MAHCPTCSAPCLAGARFCAECGAALPAVTDSDSTRPTPPLDPDSTRPTPESRRNPSTSHPPKSAGDSRFLPGALLAGRYRIVSLLGKGGMGEVYRADDIKLGQPVALKFLAEQFARDEAALAGLYAEVRIGRQVSHPNVCRLHDLIEIEGQHCLSMEFIDGEDLATLLRRIGRLPPDTAIAVARDICVGLAAAHEKGVVHRDLKPANVLIDGRGRARITDFGIAASTDDDALSGFAGTPAYMAPEQLRGEPASLQSDLFALGLLIFEIASGRRAFDAPGIDALRRQHDEVEPASLVGATGGLPPNLADAVRRCLARDPKARPASAASVLALLPGGDPLAAAIAAGETPSPAMVAAAGRSGELPVAAAWGWLALLLVMVLAGHQLAVGGAQALGLLRPAKSPELLDDRARTTLAAIGVDSPAFDHAGGFYVESAATQWLRSQDPTHVDAARFAELRPGSLNYFYRQATHPLIGVTLYIPPFQPIEFGRITRTDPPVDVPGMVSVDLDQDGRLLTLLAIPEGPFDSVRADPDWNAALRSAGLDPATLVDTEPRGMAPVDTDRRLAWDGRIERPVPMAVHVEAASFRGRPVWFSLQPPWYRPATATSMQTVRIGPEVGLTLVLAGAAATTVGIFVLVRRHLRSGRGDRRGATRLAVSMGTLWLVDLLIRSDHVRDEFAEARLIVMIESQVVFFSITLWLTYIALEPIARRRWPVLLIGWTRLLDGRWRDAMVARDLLVGMVTGVAMRLIVYAACAYPQWIATSPLAPHQTAVSPLTSGRHLLHFILGAPGFGAMIALSGLFGLYLARYVLRNRWLGWLVQCWAMSMIFHALTEFDHVALLPVLLITVVWFTLLTRAGLLAGAAAIATFVLVMVIPPVWSTDSWLFARSALAWGFLLLLAVAAFWSSLGGKSPLGEGAQDDEDRL